MYNYRCFYGRLLVSAATLAIINLLSHLDNAVIQSFRRLRNALSHRKGLLCQGHPRATQGHRPTLRYQIYEEKIH